ncbi:hypothetical protein Verru16b_03179 [Lacunisphaera limnophila]|uniref:Uncharacterized protein n=1 Tax=Lacunisphaera limnophila TaxID=1838286 RepID=A0A1D8AYZ8_9BACT|nr:hypothetical protein [Lacunisphaera limnophila]AOS46084.1 hypothetical protein Verru16b_03179 [Lacunisphaera limnophila]
MEHTTSGLAPTPQSWLGASPQRANKRAHRWAEIPNGLSLQFRQEPSLVRFSPDGLILKFASTTYVVTPWPGLEVYYLTVHGQRKPIPALLRPPILTSVNELRQSSNQTQRLAIHDLIRNLPLWIHARLVPMRQRYWLGIETLADMPESLRLLESSPALFAAMSQYAAAGCLNGDQRTALRALLQGRQRELTDWLGFGGAEACCKILRKLSHYDYSYSQWRALARCMRQTEIRKVLQKAPTIPCAIVDFLVIASDTRLFTSRALGQVAAELLKLGPSWIKQRELIDEVLTCGSLMRKYGIAPVPMSSYTDYRRLHSQFSDAVDDVRMTQGPLLVLDDVEPIITPRDLKQEAAEMEHCVGSLHFIMAGLRGTYCFYRMVRPDRATICLERSSGLDSWKVAQIQGQKNSGISDTTMDMIHRAVAAST